MIAETTCSSVVDSAANSPAALPSRRTKMRSATSKTSTRLWLITTTPSSRSRRRRIRFSTCAVWATPSAAVGSSSSTTLGSPSSERATATCWRWPPERVPTSLRRLGIVTARLESSSPVWCSIRASSSWRETVPETGRDLLAAEEEVGDDVEVVAEGEVLVDGRDPQRGRVLGLGDRDLLAVEADRALVGGVDAGDRLHQRRLAGAVVADQADDLAGVDGEVDPVQAWTGPNRLLTPSSSRSGAPVLMLSPRFPLLCTRPRRRRCRVRRR